MKNSVLILLLALLCFSCDKESETFSSLTSGVWSNPAGSSKLQFNKDNTYWAESETKFSRHSVDRRWRPISSYYDYRRIIEYQGQHYEIQKSSTRSFYSGNWELQDNIIQLTDSHVHVVSTAVILVNNKEITVSRFPYSSPLGERVRTMEKVAYIYTNKPNAQDTIICHSAFINGGEIKEFCVEYKYIYMEDKGDYYTGNIPGPIELRIEKMDNNSLELGLNNFFHGTYIK